MNSIILSTPEVQAILSGRKTRHSLPMKVQPVFGYECDHSVGLFDMGDGNWACRKCGWGVNHDGSSVFRSPLRAGQIVPVRENGWKYNGKYFYDADYRYGHNSLCPECKTFTSATMPRDAARLWLRVLEDSRPQRVRDITDAEAEAEGIARLFDYMSDDEFFSFEANAASVVHRPMRTKADYGFKNYMWHGDFGKYGMGNKQSDAWEYQYSAYESARDSFSSLWHRDHAHRGYHWDTAWAWVTRFEMAEGPSNG